MRRHGQATWPADVIVTALAALVALGVGLVVENGPLATAALLPLVLILPGYALIAALLPPAALRRDVCTALTVALSLACTALGGLFIQLFADLTRGVMLGYLGGFTLVVAAVAFLRRRDHPPTHRTIGHPRPLAAALILVALGLAGVAVAVASAGAHRELDSERFSELWLLPERSSPHQLVAVGASNHEGRTISYVVRLTRSGTPLRSWSIRLQNGAEWHRRLPASTLRGSGRLVAALLRDGTLERRVAIHLEREGGSEGG